jgi:hypothetical protein
LLFLDQEWRAWRCENGSREPESDSGDMDRRGVNAQCNVPRWIM